MSERTIVRHIRETRVIVRQATQEPRVIVRNRGPIGPQGEPGADGTDATNPSILLFSTDLRTGYADATALGAAIAAGTHPIFDPSSDFDEVYVEFDDVVKYQGRGTVKVRMGSWLDKMLATPAVDLWVRAVFRWSPTFETTVIGLGSTAGHQGGVVTSLYDDNVNYGNDWSLIPRIEPVDTGTFTSLDMEGDVAGGTDLTSDFSLTPAQVRDGSWRDQVMHFVRADGVLTLTFWMNGVRYVITPLAQNEPGGFPDQNLLEFGFYGDKDGTVGFPYDNVNDYVNVALLEAYEGGDPYGLDTSILPDALAEVQKNLDALEIPTLPIAESDVTGLVSDLAAKASAASVTGEAATRAADDTTLAGLISAEAGTRASAVSGEAATRSSADTTLQSNITTEASTRSSADSSEASTRGAADTALDGRATTLEAVAPTANQKAALAGTGTPSGSDKYVNNSDSRMTDARTPTAHTHPESEVTNLVTDLAGKQPFATNLTAISALVGASDRLAYFTGSGTLSLATFTAFGRTLAALADYAALRSGAGLVIGTDVQAWAAKLDALVALSWAADKLPYFTSASAVATSSLSSYIRTLLDDADAATARGTLGLAALAILATVGTAQIDDDAVTNAKLANMANATIKGRTTAGTGDPEDLTASQVRTILSLVIGTNVQAWSSILDALVAFTSISDGQTVKRSGSSYIGYTPGAGGLSDGDYGDISVSGTGTVLSVDNDVVTNAKAANMAVSTIKGRLTAGTGDPEDLTASQVKTLLGLVIGTDIEAYSAVLAALAAWTGITDGESIRRSGTGFASYPDTTFYGWRRFKSGNYYDGGAITLSAGNLNTTQSMATPFYVGVTTTFDRLAIEVTLLGISSVIRLAIYSDTNGYPGARVYDGGTIDASSIGVKALTISQQLTPGLYWLVAQAEVAAPQVRRITTGVGAYFAPGSLTAGTDFSILYCGWTCNSGVSAGSNPNPWYSGAVPSGQIARLMLRAA